MLSPVPGLTYLKVLAPHSEPPPQPLPPAPSPAPDDDPRRAAAALVVVALQAAFGMRPVERLPRRTYAPPVRVHINARLRASTARGPVRLHSLHMTGREAFGTARARGRIYGFTAVVEDGRMKSFRVL